MLKNSWTNCFKKEVHSIFYYNFPQNTIPKWVKNVYVQTSKF